MSINYTEILTEMYPGSEWSMSNEDYATLKWLSDGVKPTQKDLYDKKTAAANLIDARQAAVLAARTAALAKLAALGLTTDDLKALGL